MSPSPYRVLFVCTGNVCRSPFMERLARARIDAALGTMRDRIEVTSRGTGALIGSPMTDETAAVLREYGGDPGEFRSKQLTAADIEVADLVLTAERSHRGQVVTEVPRAAARTATAREFARLLNGITVADLVPAGADPAEQLRFAAARAFERRGFVPAAEPADDDIPDPYRRPRERYLESAALIEAALTVPLSLLVA